MTRGPDAGSTRPDAGAAPRGRHTGSTRLGAIVVAWTTIDPVHLTRGHAGGQAATSASDLAALSDADRERAGQLTPDRRARFVAGRRLLISLVDAEFPTATYALRPARCVRCGRDHAGPVIDGVDAVASLAFSSGIAVAALAPTAAIDRLGVDVERDDADATRSEDLSGLLGASGGPVLRRWTRIEAVVKADGRGLAIDPADVRLRGDGARITGDATRYQVAGVTGPPGYWISVAWRAPEARAASAGTARRRTAAPGGVRSSETPAR